MFVTHSSFAAAPLRTIVRECRHSWRRPPAAMARLLLRCRPIVLRLCAAWLVLMIVLPFSAPFSTCDLAAFLHPGHHDDQAAAHHVRPAALVHDAATHALPHTRAAHRNPWLTSSTLAPEASALQSVSGARYRVTSLTLVGPPLLPPLRI